MPLRSKGINDASVGSAAMTTRCPAFKTSGSNFCAALPMSQCPSLEIPMGTASYLSGSIPRITEAADASETSCSPLRPPNKTPTRNRFLVVVMRTREWRAERIDPGSTVTVYRRMRKGCEIVRGVAFNQETGREKADGGFSQLPG